MAEFSDWIALFLRWFHVIAGIAWIGSSFYFVWLDNSLEEPPEWKKQKGIKGDLWSIHGGGFYEIAKYKVGPEKMPENLHWFKWEAYTTFITGSLLLIWLYYLQASAYMVDPEVMELTAGAAVGLSLLFIFSGWAIYEVLCNTPLVRNGLVFLSILLVIGTVYAWLFTHFFSGRAAYIQMGAMIGMVMAVNVMLRIIPGQKKMVAQVAAGEAVDPQPGLIGKQRSVHNNYFTLPLIFMMISNHYPMTYQHEYNWLVLMAIVVITIWTRHYFNLKHQGRSKPVILVTAALAFAVLAFLVSYQPATASTSTENVSFSHVQQIINDRCTACHSRKPTDELFPVAPLGMMFNDQKDIERHWDRIVARATVSKDMPFNNRTHMTEEERKILAQWQPE
ncbi:urate hydroxylase PuuD [Gynuella sunshinyii]|uniref:Putative membrane protein n=1 Tax=Gynuella sunshinyii YC6258 TaxID=1445510 RepID=A0A0C5VFF7_9GAMM|nr:urate hydroxylase PuuD [Gynuella sunshinyii]AJQ92133.1 putative membrane protein [Gynuella sunshinyii YC6258]